MKQKYIILLDKKNGFINMTVDKIYL